MARKESDLNCLETRFGLKTSQNCAPMTLESRNRIIAVSKQMPFYRCGSHQAFLSDRLLAFLRSTETWPPCRRPANGLCNKPLALANQLIVCYPLSYAVGGGGSSAAGGLEESPRLGCIILIRLTMATTISPRDPRVNSSPGMARNGEKPTRPQGQKPRSTPWGKPWPNRPPNPN
jgi:hypothetical protein